MGENPVFWEKVAQMATPAGLGASNMFGDNINYDAQNQVNSYQ